MKFTGNCNRTELVPSEQAPVKYMQTRVYRNPYVGTQTGTHVYVNAPLILKKWPIKQNLKTASAMTVEVTIAA